VSADIEPRIARKFQAGWTEGVIAPPTDLRYGSVDERAAFDAGGEPPPMPAAWDLARPIEDRTVFATIRAAAKQGLPTLFDPAGMTFAAAIPVLLEHGGEMVGYVTDVRRHGAGFAVAGWIYDQHAEAAARKGYVSPGLQLRSAAIVRDALFVTESEVVELSVCVLPVLEGTYFRLDGGPVRLPESQRFAAMRDRTFRAHTGAAEERYQARQRELEALDRAQQAQR
jgi:hypothetical protein